MRLAELCAGYAGLGMGLALAGIDTELAWYAENDIHAAKVLAHHHPEVPNLDDLTRITDPPPVDIITAGWPCQPVSTAGLRKGTEDGRWIIDDVCRVARLAGARWLVLENVTGLLTANDGDAMGRVCAALAYEGFSRWEWTTIRASDIGAPHGRNRWFCVATADTDGQRCGRKRGGGIREDGDAQPGRDVDGCDRARFGGYAEAVHHWEHILGRAAPDPTDDGRLNPVFVEWMMGLPEGHVTGVPDLTRPQQLKILGNGVVPLQAAAAVTELCLAAVSR